MPFKTPGAVSEYLRGLYGPETDPLLSEMLCYADEHYIPVLLPESAAFLKALVTALRPAVSLEIGTAIGYSAALILRYGGGRLITIEKDESRAEKAKEYLARAGLSGRATVFVGDACEIVPLVEGEADFVFMDGPKTKYPVLLPYVTRLLKPGGILLADNVLWNGFADDRSAVPHEKETIVRGIDEFLAAAVGSDDYEACVLPVGDGMSFGVKK